MTKRNADETLSADEKATLAKFGAHLEQMGALLAGSTTIADLRRVREYASRITFEEVERIDLGDDDDEERDLPPINRTADGAPIAGDGSVGEIAAAKEPIAYAPGVVHTPAGPDEPLPVLNAGLEWLRIKPNEWIVVANAPKSKPFESMDNVSIGG